MSARKELILKSVLEKILFKELLCKLSKLYLSTLLAWLIIISLIQIYLDRPIHIFWAISLSLSIHFLNQRLSTFFSDKTSILHHIETQLINNKVLKASDQGVLLVLGNQLEPRMGLANSHSLWKNRKSKTSTNLDSAKKKTISREMLSLMYARLEKHIEHIQRYTPEFPKELLITCLVCIYFFAPQLLQNLDTSMTMNPSMIRRQVTAGQKQKPNSKKEQSLPIQNNQYIQDIPKKQKKWPKSLSSKLNHSLSRTGESSSDSIQTDSESNRDSSRKKDNGNDAKNDNPTQMSKAIIAQLGGRVSAYTNSSINRDSDQRLIELRSLLRQSHKGSKKVKSKSSKDNIKTSLQVEQIPLSQSRRQELKNTAYLLGVQAQVQAKDFPTALRTLIQSR